MMQRYDQQADGSYRLPQGAHSLRTGKADLTNTTLRDEFRFVGVGHSRLSRKISFDFPAQRSRTFTGVTDPCYEEESDTAAAPEMGRRFFVHLCLRRCRESDMQE